MQKKKNVIETKTKEHNIVYWLFRILITIKTVIECTISVFKKVLVSF